MQKLIDRFVPHHEMMPIYAFHCYLYAQQSSTQDFGPVGALQPKRHDYSMAKIAHLHA